MDQQVIIRHPQTGHEYGIRASDFRSGLYWRLPDGRWSTFADAGFRIVSAMDGQSFVRTRRPLPETADAAVVGEAT